MFLFLLAIWIIFNGQFTLEILIFGILISLAVCLFSVKFLDYSFRKEFMYLKKLPLLIAYVFVLIWEIIKANFCVAGLIIKGRKKTHAIVHTFKSPVKTGFAQTLLANSITLTPGTITVSLSNDEYKVHCLDEKLCEGIEESGFVKLLQKIEET